MITHNHAQGSVEWMQLRAGIPTASEFDQLVTPKFEIRKGQMVVSYLAAKLAERWLGGPLAQFNSFDMDQGRILEDEAKPWYSLQYNEPITSVGFLTTDDGKIGCSPDGLLGEEGGIEIKCPDPKTHCRYLMAGEVPDDYLAQVHGAMFVSGRPWWKFVSYRRRFPALVIQVSRDEKIQQSLGEALTLFVDRLDRAYQKLCELNGGPPRREPLRPIVVQDPEWMVDEVGIIP